MSIVERLARVQERIAAAARAAGRDPGSVTLVAVTKTHPPEVVAEAIAAGARDLGENRVQEAAAKIEALAAHRPAVRWHLIGHLQRNKARAAAPLFDLVHSVDSLRLATALAQHARELRGEAGPLPILLQINVSGEETKEGFALPGGAASGEAFEAFLDAVYRITELPAIEVRGLMTVAPIVDHPDQARPHFRALRALRDELARRVPKARWDELSMGMTDDFEAAIAEGATIVRVGRAIFGERG